MVRPCVSIPVCGQAYGTALRADGTTFTVEVDCEPEYGSVRDEVTEYLDDEGLDGIDVWLCDDDGEPIPWFRIGDGGVHWA